MTTENKHPKMVMTGKSGVNRGVQKRGVSEQDTPPKIKTNPFIHQSG